MRRRDFSPGDNRQLVGTTHIKSLHAGNSLAADEEWDLEYISRGTAPCYSVGLSEIPVGWLTLRRAFLQAAKAVVSYEFV